MGAKANPVVVITAADLESNGGQYKLVSKYAMKVSGNDALAAMGGTAMVVYPVSQAQIDSGEFELVQGHPVDVAQVTDRGQESSAWAMPVYHEGPGTWPPGGGGSSLDAEYLVYQGAMVVEPSQAWADAASQLFVDLRAALGVASLTDALDFCYILATETEQAALINMINPGTHDATNVDSMAFEASRGFTGNGTSSYLNSNYNPATQGINYLQNSASFGVYIRTELDGTAVDGGALGGANRDTRINSRFSNFFIGNININANNLFVANPTSLSLFVLNRSGSTQSNIYRAGVSIGSSTSASVGVPANNFFIGAFNNSGTAAFFSARQCAFAFAGGSMDATQQADFFTSVETFMDAIGAGVSATPTEEPNVVFEPLTMADSLGGVLLAQQGVSPTSNFGAYAGL